MRRSLWLAGLFLGALSLTACLMNKDCDAKPFPLAGSIEDYATPAGELDGVRLNRPVACGDTLATGGHLIVLAGLGLARWDFRASADGGCPAEDETSCAVDRDAFLSAVYQQLEQAGIETYGGFGEVCRTSATQWIGLYFHLLDWARADQAVAILVSQLQQRGLGEEVAVLLAPLPVDCAH